VRESIAYLSLAHLALAERLLLPSLQTVCDLRRGVHVHTLTHELSLSWGVSPLESDSPAASPAATIVFTIL
jgi:hypothetical protein